MKRYTSCMDRRHFLKGSLDEVRVSNTARLADWIATTYNNQSAPSTFYSISDEGTATPTPTPTPTGQSIRNNKKQEGSGLKY